MKRIIVGLLLLVFAVAGPMPVAKADPYLTMDRARNFALNYVWYTNCNQWDRCYQGPDLAGGTYRISDRKVAVHVNAYFRAWGKCDGTKFVRVRDDNSLTVYDESYWAC